MISISRFRSSALCLSVAIYLLYISNINILLLVALLSSPSLPFPLPFFPSRLEIHQSHICFQVPLLLGPSRQTTHQSKYKGIDTVDSSP